MSALDVFNHDTGSPFDAIKHEDAVGEYWLAREMERPLGYESWRRFEESIERASIAVNNAGMQAPDHIASTVKLVQNGLPGVERKIIDYRLTRFGAYMVAMNGDPRKPEIAAAQTYFAVKTREAETGTSSEAERIAALPKSALLTIAAEQAERAEKAEEALAIAAPKADAFEAFLSTSGDYSVNEAAKILSRDYNILTGEGRLRSWLADNGWIYRDGANKPRAYQTRIDQAVLAEKAQWHYHPTSGEKVADTPQVRVTPKGLERLRDLLRGAA